MTTYPMKLTCTKCGATDEGTLHITDEPAREWVGLTEDEINKLKHLVDWTAGWSYGRFAYELERLLREKNA